MKDNAFYIFGMRGAIIAMPLIFRCASVKLRVQWCAVSNKQSQQPMQAPL
jgi:hypothetical protein